MPSPWSGCRHAPRARALTRLESLVLRGNRRRLERVVRPLREELESWAGDLEEFEVEGDGDHKN